MNKSQEKVINAFDKFLPAYLADSYYANPFLKCYLKAKRECKFTQTTAIGIIEELEKTFNEVSMKTPDYSTVKCMFIDAKWDFLESFRME